MKIRSLLNMTVSSFLLIVALPKNLSIFIFSLVPSGKWNIVMFCLRKIII